MKKLTDQQIYCLDMLRKRNKFWKSARWGLLLTLAMFQIIGKIPMGPTADWLLYFGVMYVIFNWKGEPAIVLIDKLFEDQQAEADAPANPPDSAG